MNLKDIEKEFDEHFGEESGIYWGKDWDGSRIYIPSSALEEIKDFLIQSIKSALEEVKPPKAKEKFYVPYNSSWNDCLAHLEENINKFLSE